MSIEAKIPELLAWHLLQMPDVLPVSLPLEDFAPPKDGKYLEVSYIPNVPRQIGLSFDMAPLYFGIYQVSVAWPLGDGLLRALDVAGAVVTHFKPGTEIVRDGVMVRIYEQAYHSSQLPEPGRVVIPVTIPWAVWPD
jgi:hypothetical protein